MPTSHTNGEHKRVKARLEMLLNRLPGMVYQCSIKDDFQMTLEYVSMGSENLLGLSPEEMLEKHWNTLERMTLPSDLERTRTEIYDKIVAHEPYQVMYRLRLPTGHVKWIWDQGEGIYDDDGNIQYIEGLMMDISEQKLQELELQDENRQLKLNMQQSTRLGNIVGKSEAMHKVYALILKAAETDTNVIIYGETGCGKDLVARAIHDFGGRKGAYVPVNCGAIPENLLESEFFGYTKGAFTGATSTKDGFVAAADNGTLFLDEIGELPLHLQVKFLRVLETKRYTPLGSNTPKASSFRLISATNRDLAAFVKEKKTRADFYYRINVLAITIPPLRERKEDLPLLVKAWSERTGIELTLPHDVRLAMRNYDWPGNVRELHNFLDRYAAFGKSAADFLGSSEDFLPTITDGLTLDEATRLLEQKMILNALEKCRWRRGKAAQLLGLNIRTMQRKMKALNLQDKDD